MSNDFLSALSQSEFVRPPHFEHRCVAVAANDLTNQKRNNCRQFRVKRFKEQTTASGIVRRGSGESGDVCRMDILAAIFAYLGCLAGLFGALTVSAFLVLSPSTRSASPPQMAQSAVIDTKVSGTGILDVNAVKAAAPRDPVTTVARNSSAVTSDTPGAVMRPKSHMSHAQQRRLLQEERARRWAYQDDDFEKRFMSYAD